MNKRDGLQWNLSECLSIAGAIVPNTRDLDPLKPVAAYSWNPSELSSFLLLDLWIQSSLCSKDYGFRPEQESEVQLLLLRGQLSPRSWKRRF